MWTERGEGCEWDGGMLRGEYALREAGVGSPVVVCREPLRTEV